MRNTDKKLRYCGKKNFKDYFEFMSKNGLGDKYEIVSDIDYNDFIKSLYPIKLPKAYLEFMRYTGYGQYFVGSDYKMSDVKQLNGWAEELLEENDFPQKLPESGFVFWMHQGYMFYFFRLDEGDDPPVYYYSECEDLTGFVKCYDSFTDFIIDPYITGIPNPL